MSQLDDLIEASTANRARKPRPKHPTGYEPGAYVGEGGGFLVTQPRPLADGELVKPGNEPWANHLRKAGLNPDDVEVIPPIEVRTWDMNLGDGQIHTAVYFKARLLARRESEVDPAFRDFVLKWRPTKSQGYAGDVTVVVPWGDWQAGKSDYDDTRATVQRVLEGVDKTVDFIREHKPHRIVVAPLGDLFEGCSGHYAQQEFRTDLNLREQAKVVRYCATQGIKQFSDLASEVLVAPVGGNHGENRKGTLSFTDFGDNFDVAVFESIAERLSENEERFGHVAFAVPRSELVQTVDVQGTILGLLHGHQTKGGGDKVLNWWKGQMKARAPIGDADILLNGHWHSFLARSVGPRFHVQIPALDGGSEWFDNVAGGAEPNGQVVFTIGEDGWDNLRVL